LFAMAARGLPRRVAHKKAAEQARISQRRVAGCLGELACCVPTLTGKAESVPTAPTPQYHGFSIFFNHKGLCTSAGRRTVLENIVS
jgi:hypothetical protein